MRGWLARVGIPAGGMTGKSVRDQAERISRCKLTFDIATGGRSSGLVQQTIVDRALFIEADDGITQGRLSLETAKLSEGFFEQLKKHPRSPRRSGDQGAVEQRSGTRRLFVASLPAARARSADPDLMAVPAPAVRRVHQAAEAFQAVVP